MKRFQHYNIFTFLLFLALPAALLAQQAPTHVTGTFKTPGNQTPSQAGLRQVAAVAGLPAYGTVDFLPFDSAAGKPARILCGGVTYFPQPVRVWIRGDGTIVASSGSAGTDLIPTVGCQPAGAVYRATIRLAGTADGRLRPISWTEDKAVPNQASADWGTL